MCFGKFKNNNKYRGFLPKNLLHYTLNKKNKLLPTFKFSFNNFIGKENLNNLYLINLLCTIQTK